uniref:Ig-like domain-containing protein n=1 Tax=Astyanax mexicanus TaxID=7994 RepID=A0A8B9GPH9_ASTMX
MTSALFYSCMAVNGNIYRYTPFTNSTVSIKCRVTDMTDSVHWYQQKDGEALRRILYVNSVDAREFTVARGTYNLRVPRLKKSHSAVYYCASWERSSHSDSNHSHPVQKR